MNDTLQLPVFVVHGTNWHANVPMDEMNSQFSIESQAIEAVTKAVEAFKGIQNGILIHVDEGSETPFLGAAMRTYIQGTNPDQDMIVWSHIALGNGGFYSDSIEAAGVLEIELKGLEAEVKQTKSKIITPLGKTKLEKDIENFESLKKEVKSKGGKKGNRKKKK